MRKIFYLILGAYLFLCIPFCCANDKYDLLPDLPESLANAAQASSVSNVESASNVVTATQAIGQEPSLISMIFSLIFVILLIYATGILYTYLNKYGVKALRKQTGDLNNLKVDVLSTTPLGSNKTLHVVELDGKRMLIGASANSIHLIKDLGSYSNGESEDKQYSKIEIPNIRIPKIEIPKIEFPGFTRVSHNDVSKSDDLSCDHKEDLKDDDFQISDISEVSDDDNSDGIIDKLFQKSTIEVDNQVNVVDNNEHKVDPDEFILYKKYL